jgi:hypothetical protein
MHEWWVMGRKSSFGRTNGLVVVASLFNIGIPTLL